MVWEEPPGRDILVSPVSIADSVLQQIRDLGYAVSIHRLTGSPSRSGRPQLLPDEYTEMRAVLLAEPSEQHIARVDSQGDEADYRCTCEMAQMVGVDLEG